MTISRQFCFGRSHDIIIPGAELDRPASLFALLIVTISDDY